MPILLRRILLPIVAGLAGAMALTGVYLGIVSLAESPAHALDLFWEDRFLVIPIILGFSLQVALFVYLKMGLFAREPGDHGPRGAASGATTAAGGGVSTAAMVACCAHHLTDVLPFVGLAAAATFLAEWKVPFMVVGLLTNVLGIGVMLRQIANAHRHALACQTAEALAVPVEAAPACHRA